VKNVIDDIKKTPGYYSNWAQAFALQIHKPYEVAIIGNNWEEKLLEFHQQYLPNTIFMGGISEGNLGLLQNKLVKGKTMIYVCENKTCDRPVEKVEDAIKQIK
jgi:uncharacterized protein YyaL (SSP411 family)